mmetsp:Transcript_1320/g.1981  ORF Transcript_1320/g.1981 Transcript_1320/m.1981 type:complete len:188 (+) Transcript_1320:56-619(+)
MVVMQINEDNALRLMLIPASLIGFSVLISYVSKATENLGPYLSEASKTDASALTDAFTSSTAEQFGGYLLQSWYDNMFIVLFALFVFSVIQIGGLPKRVKSCLYATSIWLHPAFDWMENTAAIASYVSFLESGAVNESTTRKYSIFSKLKWAMLGINVFSVLVTCVLPCIRRCKHPKEDPDDQVDEP